MAHVPHFSKSLGSCLLPIADLSTPWCSDDPWGIQMLPGNFTQTFQITMSDQESNRILEVLGVWRDATRSLGQR